MKIWARDAYGRKVLIPEHWLGHPSFPDFRPVSTTPGEASALIAKAREGQKEAMEAAQRFSARNPAFAIQADSFRQAYRAKMRNADQIRDGIHLSRKREQLREEGRFANID